MARLKASTFLNKTKELEVKWDDEMLTISYYPHKFTSEMVKEFRARNNPDVETNPLDETDKFLLKILSDIGMDDDKGKPVIITQALLDSLAAPLKDNIAGAIMEDLMPGESTGVTSPDGS